jgi:hypothetical protein
LSLCPHARALATLLPRQVGSQDADSGDSISYSDDSGLGRSAGRLLEGCAGPRRQLSRSDVGAISSPPPEVGSSSCLATCMSRETVARPQMIRASGCPSFTVIYASTSDGWPICRRAGRAQRPYRLTNALATCRFFFRCIDVLFHEPTLWSGTVLKTDTGTPFAANDPIASPINRT